MRTYGTYRFIPANASDHPYYGGRTGLWVITVEPAVAVRIKRTFARVQATRTGAVTIAHSIEVARDLAWFTDRFPLVAHDPASETMLLDGEQEHRDLEVAIARALISTPDERVFTKHDPTVAPRHYQDVALNLLRTVRRLLLTDELGLGKTFSASLNFLHEDALPAVVVGPTHLVAKDSRWTDELDEHFPHLNYYVAKTGKSAEIKKLKVMPDVILLTYTKLAGWVDFLSEWAKYAVFDEVQELRTGTGTVKGTAAAHLCQSVSYAIGLTATPVMNYAGEIWSIIDILNTGVLGTRDEFLREWGQTAWSNHIKVSDPHALGSYLREQGLMLGRDRAEVGLELPKTIKSVHHIDSDRAVLDDMAASARVLAQTILSEDSSREERFHASGQIDKMLRHATGVAKAPHVAEFCHMLLESEEKIVLFGWHRDVYDIWLRSLSHFRPVMYTGTESPQQKNDALKAFKEGDSRILIMSLRSGAGVDGLEKVSRVAVFGELDWSPQVHEQGIGRLARGGITDPPLAFFLMSDDGSDPAIAEVLQIKRQQGDQLMSKDGKLLVNSTTDANRTRMLAQSVLAR